jgi:hypothetical protein
VVVEKKRWEMGIGVRLYLSSCLFVKVMYTWEDNRVFPGSFEQTIHQVVLHVFSISSSRVHHCPSALAPYPSIDAILILLRCVVLSVIASLRSRNGIQGGSRSLKYSLTAKPSSKSPTNESELDITFQTFLLQQVRLIQDDPATTAFSVSFSADHDYRQG